MEDIIDRLFSFLYCPDNIILPTLSLAESGFWFTGEGDEVECYRCHLRLKHCKHDDIPAEKHFYDRPQCPVAVEAYRKFSEHKNLPSEITMSNQTECNSDKVHKQSETSSFSKEPTAEQFTKQENNPLTSEIFYRHLDNYPSSNEFQESTENVVSSNLYRCSESDASARIFTEDALSRNNEKSDLRKDFLQCNKADMYEPLLQRDTCTTRALYPSMAQLQKTHPPHHSQMDSQRPVENVSTVPYEPSFEIYDASKQTPVVPVRNHPISLDVDYKVAENRRATFSDWPSNAIITAEEAVEAGLYYTGQGDKVVCAWCKGGLYDWDVGDTAMGEHSRHFPLCSFVSQFQASSDNRTDVNGTPRDHKGIGKETEKEITRTDWRDFNAVKLALSMGIDERLIETAVKKHKLSSSTMISDLIDIVYQVENDEVSETSDNNTKPENPSSLPSSFEKKKVASQSEDTNAENELSLLLDENQRLKSMKTCTVCLEEEISMVFLPCRHLVCCKHCSESLEKCPICRVPIVGTVNLN